MATANCTCVSWVAYAPGTIAVNVTWIDREFNACQTSRSMYPSIFNHFWDIVVLSVVNKWFSTVLVSERAFLRASAMMKHVIDIGWTSVRLSITRWHPIKTAEYIVMISLPHDSPFILVFCVERSSRNSDGVTPYGAAKQRWGLKMSQFLPR